MNWLVFLYALEIGLLPNNSFVMYQKPADEVFDQAFYIQFESEIEMFRFLFLGGSIRTYLWKDKKGISFWPSRDGYQFNVGFRYKFLEVGFRHYCTHPVIPYRYPIQMNWEGSYQEIYLRLSNK
jgi:hypothetical protein